MKLLSIPFCVILLLVMIGCADTDPAQMSEADLRATAETIHDAVITIDSHDDIPLDFATESVDPLNGVRQVNLESMRTGGLDVAFFIVFVGQTERTPENYAQAKTDAMTKFDAIHRMADEMYPDLIELAYSADDVHNDISDSARPRPEFGDEESEHDGISAFGERVIAEMNRLGIMVDVSHISKAAALDAIRLSRAPVIASHSNTRAVRDHFRNMGDETLLALKDNGGVMQATALAEFVKALTPEQQEATSELLADSELERLSDALSLSADERGKIMTRLREIGYADVGDFIDHVDHAVDLIGIDHVGLSSDFDGGGGIVDWFDAGETLNVTLELVRRGYSRDDIEKLWGGNLLRVWREVEEVAAESG